MSTVSFIICSIDDAKFQAVSSNIDQRMAGGNYEIIGVHDAKSLCEGYNRAIPHARGEIVVFCHDDIEILSADFSRRLDGHMRNFDVAGIAGASRIIGGLWSYAGPPYIFGQVAHPELNGNGFLVQIFAMPRRSIGNIAGLDGVFIAARRDVLAKIRFDEKTFDGWHGYDIDFSFAAHLVGFRLGVMADVQVLHQSIGNIEGPWQEYVLRFNRKYLEQLHPMPRRSFIVEEVHVANKADLLEVMTPAYWDQA